ncbi:MAG: asparagine synthase (glutamine-hydrolyzing) [Nitrospirae bacterium]|nr:asparagine synthase (glutamine-hydrolyzing) [Nitrospirota bacterium]
MCGILGIVDKKGIDGQQLRKMRDTMVHRGPDDSGCWISRNKEVGLAHRRLSIIDLSEAGRQPMPDSKEKIWVIFNGEIYNFREIRTELKEKGHKFVSRSDTEVIIYAYKEWGTDCLQKFNGMFAFGIYDEEKRVLFLARDRLGKKPLYYSHNIISSKFVFASEIKALLKDEYISRDIDLQALNFYFTFGYIPGELCIFKNIRKLPPAHAMVYDLNSGEQEIWSYWDVPHLKEEHTPEDDLLDQLENLIEDAVRTRMLSDVPLGAFLSGGVDSSVVVAMMSRASDKPVQTFSIGFEDGAYNELPYAKIVAKHFGTEHHELIVKPDAVSILPELVRQFDEPFADSSMIPTYYVSRATREHVTVALSGDGGDEIFGGYKIYLASLFDHYARRLIPFPVRKGLANLAEIMPVIALAKIRKQLLMMRGDMSEAFIQRCIYLFFKEKQRRLIFDDEILRLLNNELAGPELSRRVYLERWKGDLINRLTFTDLKTYLPDDILVKVDRASMLVSLETRAPLLDYRIAEFSFKRIPGNLKVRGMTTKYLLKKLAKRILPDELNVNRKWGFSIPISDWFRGALRSDLRDILLGHKSIFCNQNQVKRLLDEHETGVDNSSRLFALLIFYLWEKEYLA